MEVFDYKLEYPKYALLGLLLLVSSFMSESAQAADNIAPMFLMGLGFVALRFGFVPIPDEEYIIKETNVS